MATLFVFAEWLSVVLLASVAINVLRQLLPRSRTEPPVVFHWFPFIGNVIRYGMDPVSFFRECRAKHGDIFTFVFLGKKMTCYLGIDGNEFILNGKHQDLSAEEIYGPLTIPVFGSDVVYDVPNAKFMEQKKFVKYGLTQSALESHVPRIEREVLDYVRDAPSFQGQAGTADVTTSMSEITIFTAGRALQGDEVREKLTTEFASLYHDLDNGFRPINFLLPWAPLPLNRKRDIARDRMRDIYIDIINKRRQNGVDSTSDMISNLMACKYKDGTPVPDKEIAHMMITLLMAGQHTSASASSWIVLHLASRPDITEELYEEQVQTLQHDGKLPPLQYSDLDKLPRLRNVVMETLRVHSSIHSVMRKVKRPIAVPGTPYIVNTDKVLLSSPYITACSDEFFPRADEWDPHRWEVSEDGIKDDEIDFDDPTTYSKGSRSPYLPFGAGRHRCIGEKFAYLNLAVIVSTLVREFRFNTLDGAKSVPKTDYTSLFSCPERPAVVSWERRTK